MSPSDQDESSPGRQHQPPETHDIEALLLQQKQRWDSGCPLHVEALVAEYLEQSLAKSLSSEAWLDLICHEVSLREEHGDRPTLAEYQERFPSLSETLSIQWDINRLLDVHDTSISQTTKSIDTNVDSTHKDIAKSHTSIHRYVMHSELGRGGIGVVYEAWDSQLKRRLAIKRLRAGLDAGQEDLDRMRSEAEAIAKIQSPYIVQIFDVGEADGLPFFAMEFCEGGSLAKRLDKKPIPYRTAADIALCISRGIAAAHACRIIHRDLKPGNILLERVSDWSPKIADFGLAKFLDRDSSTTATGNLLGTPAYMAPE